MSKTECDYCRGVGACPKCWGRANIEELKAERDRAVGLLRRITDKAQYDGPLTYIVPVDEVIDARAFLKEVDNG